MLMDYLHFLWLIPLWIKSKSVSGSEPHLASHYRLWQRLEQYLSRRDGSWQKPPEVPLVPKHLLHWPDHRGLRKCVPIG